VSAERDPARLRVCIVTPHVTQHAIGGMQQHTDDLARGLVAAGHSATILTSRVPGTPPPPDGVELVSADADRPASVYTREWGAASAALFERLHAERPYDVVHAEGGGALGLVRRGVARRIPTVVLYHGNWLGFVRAELRAGWARRPRWYGLLKWGRHSFDLSRIHFGEGHWRAYRDLESIVPCRAHLEDTIGSHLLSRARTHVVLHGVDVKRFTPGRNPGFRRRFGVSPGTPLIMTLGRLAADKGNDFALRAFAQLGESDARLAIVGEGEQDADLRRLAGRLGIGDRVIFTGAVPQAEVPDALRAADIFWFPTVRDEAAGLVAPQAMATGLPVVATRIGGVPEYVGRPGRDALLVPPANAEALAEATRHLLSDPQRRDRIGEAARACAIANYSIETMTMRTIDVYRIAIERYAIERAR
jgi:glycosyltransferase involved in cell wall biosynthesis